MIRKTFIPFFGIFILLCGLTLMSAGIWIRSSGAQWISEKFSIEIKSASSNFFNSVSLKNVNFPGPEQNSIDRIKLAIQPWSLLNIHPKDRKLLHVKITGANWTLSLSKKNNEEENRFKLPNQSIKTTISDSNIVITKKNQQTTLKDINGTLSYSPRLIDTHLFIGESQLKAHYKKNRKNYWESEIVFTDFNIHPIFSLIKTNSPEWGETTGQFNSQFNIAGTGKTIDFSKSDWTLKFNTENIQWKRAPHKKPVPIRAKFSISPELASIETLRIDRTVNLKGLINNPLSQPELNLSLTSQNFNLSHLKRFFDPESGLEQLKGRAEIDAHLSGVPSNPNIAGSFHVKSKYGPMHYPPVSGDFTFENHELDVDSDFSRGKIYVNGKMGKSNKYPTRILVKNISLSSVAKKNGWKNVKGKFNSNLVLKFPEATPHISGSFKLEQFQWGRHRKKAEINGAISAKPNVIAVTTKDESLLVNASLNGNDLNLNKFKIDFGDDSYFSAHGYGNIEKGQLSFSLSAKSIPPDIWPPLVAHYPDIQGSMDFSGSVIGSTYNPRFQLDLLVNELKFIELGESWNGTTQLSLDKTGMSMKNLKIDGGFRGDVHIKNENNNRHIAANFDLENSPPQFFLDIFKSTISVSGQLNGTTQLDYDRNTLVVTSSTTWTAGHFDKFNFDKANLNLKSIKDEILIEQFNVVQGNHGLRANGKLKNYDGVLKGSVETQLNQWGTDQYVFDGDAALSGTIKLRDLTVNGNIGSPILWVNDYPLDEFTARFSRKKEAISFKINATDQINGTVAFNYITKRFKGKISGQSIQIEPLFKNILRINPRFEIPSGLASYEIRAKGSLDAPSITMNMKSDNAAWRDEQMSSEIFLHFNQSTVTIKAARATLKEGGIIFASGVIPIKSTESIKIEGAGTNVNLQSVFHLLRWPVKWEGRTNATFEMNGPKGQSEMLITFDGTHEGYGPFPDDGELLGSIKWANQEWDLSKIRITSGNGFVKCRKNSRVFLDKNRSGRSRIIADIRNLKSGVLTYFGQVEMTGSWDAWEKIKDEKKPPIEVDVFARPLWINQFVLDGNITHLSIQDGDVQFSPIPGSGQQLSGTVSFRELPDIKVTDFKFIEDGTEQVYLDGYVGQDFWDFKGRLKKVDAGVVRGLFDTLLPISGPMDIDLTGKGSLLDPIVDAKVRWSKGFIGPVPLDLATSRINLKDGIVTINDIWAMKKKGYILTGDIKMGTALLPDNKTFPPHVDLKIAKGNFALLETIWPDCSKAKGSYIASLKVGEENGVRTISGYLNADDLSLRSSTYIPKMKKGRIKMAFDENRLQIEEARAKIGRGHAQMRGYIDFVGGRPSFYNLDFVTPSRKGISIRVPELAIPPGPILGRFNILNKKLASISRGEPKITLSYSGEASQPLMKGVIVLENSVFTYPPSKEVGNPKKSTAFSRWLNDYVKKINWDIIFNTEKKTQYENKLVNAGIEGSLHVNGLSSDLSVNGRVHSEKGSIIYAGNEFKIIEATLETVTQNPTIDGITEKQIFVYLKANAEKDVYYTDFSGNNVSDTVIMEVDRSLLGEIQPRFRSKNNASLTSEKAFQLAMGIPLKESLQNDFILADQQTNNQANDKENMDVFLRASLVQLLDSSLASPLARAITRRTGLVDSIRLTYEENDPQDLEANVIDPNETDDEEGQNEWWRQLKGTKVKLGRELSGRLFADYSFKVDEFENELDFRHEVELAYRLHRNLFIRAISELDTERTLGRTPDRRALLENRWRFGLPKKKKGLKKEDPTKST